MRSCEHDCPGSQVLGAVADFIDTTYRPRTALDAGCGNGSLIAALRKRGIDARGFDVSDAAISQVPDALRPFCAVASVTDEIAGTYDLITCIEVFQYLPEEVAEPAIDNLTRHTDRIFFSSSPHDAVEPTHVNVRPPNAWVRAFGARGFFPLPTMGTLLLTPQAIVFERREPALLDELGLYERIRYELAHDSRAAREDGTAQSAELDALTAQFRQLEFDEQVRRDAARRTIVALENRAELAEAAADDFTTALQEIRTSRWWRLGRPMRDAVTFLRTLPLAGRTESSGGESDADTPVPALPSGPLPPLPELPWRDTAGADGVTNEAPTASAAPPVDELVAADPADDVPAPTVSASVGEIVAERFPRLRPLALYPVPTDGRRHLTVVVDSLSENALLGGVGTSLILGAMVADQLDASLRVVTRREPPDPTNFRAFLRAHEVEWEKDLEFSYAPFESGGSSLQYRGGEVFLTTSWWTTWAASRSVDPQRVVYLLQEDERAFYPAGDEQAACGEVLADSRIRFAVRTSMLRDLLVSDGFDNIAENGVVFEPAFPPSIYFREARDAGLRRFCFFAESEGSRHLFLPGLEAIEEALVRAILDPKEWELHFVGSGMPPVALARRVVPILWEDLSLLDHMALIRTLDVGLSLTSTPPGSYPPLEVAACGGVALTNHFGTRQGLDGYSRNIVCTRASRDALVDGIAAAVRLAEDETTRALNYESQQLSRSWRSSLDPAVEQIVRDL